MKTEILMNKTRKIPSKKLNLYARLILNRNFSRPVKSSGRYIRKALQCIIPLTRFLYQIYHKYYLLTMELSLWNYSFPTDPHPIPEFNIRTEYYFTTSAMDYKIYMHRKVVKAFDSYFERRKSEIVINLVRFWLKDVWYITEKNYDMDVAKRAVLTLICDNETQIQDVLTYLNAHIEKFSNKHNPNATENSSLSSIFDLFKNPAALLKNSTKGILKEFLNKIDTQVSEIYKQQNLVKKEKSLSELFIPGLSNKIGPFVKNVGIVQHVYEIEKNNNKIGTANTKTKGEVYGSNRKPWRQKGTGRARAGSKKSPLWKGGGVVFGPKSTQVKSKKINKKSKLYALKDALFLRFYENYPDSRPDHFFIFDQDIFFQDFNSTKTKAFYTRLKLLKINPKVKTIMIVSLVKPNYKKAAENIKNFKLYDINELKLSHLLEAADVYFSSTAWVDFDNKLWSH